jgi:hypothetical protein
MDSLYARVGDVQWENVLERWDSIKYIILEVRDTIGSYDIAHLRISRQGGLIQGTDLNYPYEFASFILAGILSTSEPELSGGIAFPTAAAIYAQEIGDERHLLETHMYQTAGGYYLKNTERQQRLVEQWRSPEEEYLWQVWTSSERIYQYGEAPQRTDTLYRQQLDTSRISLWNWPDNPFPVGSIQTVWEDELPTQAVWSWQASTTPEPYFCEQLQLIRLADFLPTEGCLTPPPIHSDPNPWYYNRFGGPYFSRIYSFAEHVRRVLVYYRTADGEACGIPYDFVVNTEDLINPPASLRLYPNPVAEVLYWTLTPEIAETQPAQLLNAQGQVISQQTLASGQWDTSALPRGVYWLRWQTRDKQTHLQSFLKN